MAFAESPFFEILILKELSINPRGQGVLRKIKWRFDKLTNQRLLPGVLLALSWLWLILPSRLTILPASLNQTPAQVHSLFDEKLLLSFQNLSRAPPE